MKDLIKAILIGGALVVGMLAIPIILAVLVPVAIFVVIVGTIWFILKLCQE